MKTSIMGEKVRIVGDHKRAGTVGTVIDEYKLNSEGFRTVYTQEGGREWVNVEVRDTCVVARRENVEVV